MAFKTEDTVDDITETDTYKLVTRSLEMPRELIYLIWRNVHSFNEEPLWLSALFTYQEMSIRIEIPLCKCKYDPYDPTSVGWGISQRCPVLYDFHYCICVNNKTNECNAKTHKCVCKLLPPNSINYCQAATHICICYDLYAHIHSGQRLKKYSDKTYYKFLYYHNSCKSDTHVCRCKTIHEKRVSSNWLKNNIIPCLASEDNHDFIWRDKLDNINGIYRSDIGTHRLRKQKHYKGSKAMHGKKSRQKGGDFRL